MASGTWWSENGPTAVAALVSRLIGDPYGQTTPTAYETARLVALSPWLIGHQRRLRFLVATQRADGCWGGPDSYSVVPTLSATEALLQTLRRPPTGDSPTHRELVHAVDRGLGALFARLAAGARQGIPDTIAAEVLVPQLVHDINEHIDLLAGDPIPGMDAWQGVSRRLGLPAGIDAELPARLRAAAMAGHVMPEKLWHSLEFLGADACGAAGVRVANGVVGGSPAATAAWLGGATVRIEHEAAVVRLETLQARHNGPVPGVWPIDYFERGWVLGALSDAGIEPLVPWQLMDDLRGACGPAGVPAGHGLTPDSDDTAGVLHALAGLGSPGSTDCLLAYRDERYFRCFQGERTPSTTTNAHILDAFTDDRSDPARRAALAGESAMIVRWLRDQQQPDGSWWDKWHASPYYATQCCALALARVPGTEDMVNRAVSWLLATQQADGSWGRWGGTEEETAYAVQILLRTNTSANAGQVVSAAARGCGFLLRPDRDGEHAPLWHDKDLYAPVKVIDAARLAALHMATKRPDVAELVPWPAATAGVGS